MRFFVPITLEKLKNKIENTLGENYDYRYLTPIVKKDLDKVDFSTENFDAGQDGFTHKDLVGYHMLSNGMSILGVSAGGDWEWPIFYCIYFDGKKLRGYIPEKGNTWNTDTKKAYGNDPKTDLRNAKKRWPDKYPPDLKFDEDDYDDIEPIGNTYEMAKDIIDRIVRKVEKPKHVVIKLVLEPVLGWNKDTIATLINSGCNIPNIGGNVYQVNKRD